MPASVTESRNCSEASDGSGVGVGAATAVGSAVAMRMDDDASATAAIVLGAGRYMISPVSPAPMDLIAPGPGADRRTLSRHDLDHITPNGCLLPDRDYDKPWTNP